MKKLLSVILAVMMVMSSLPTFANTGMATGGGGMAADPVIAAGGTLIFEEDFESGYALDTNLLDASATSVTLKRDDVDIIKFTYTDVSTQSAMVTKTSSLNSTNVLKLSSSDTTKALANYIYLNGGDNLDSELDSKQIIVEYDMLIPAESASLSKSNGIMSITATASPYLKNSWNGKDLNAQIGYYPRSGNTTDKDWFARPTIKTTTAKTIKYVVERNMTNFDSIRLYENGKIVKTSFDSKTEWNGGRIVKDFMNEENSGTYQIGGYPTGATNLEFPKINYLYTAMIAKPATNATGEGLYATIYLDNIKVYAVEPIEYAGLESSTAINPEDGIVVKFDQPFNATKDTFKVTTTADADVANAIKSVTMAEDKMSATVKMDFGILEAETRYKIWVDDEFTSAAGAIFHKDLDGVAGNEEYVELDSFTTCEKLDVVISPAAGTILDYDKNEAAEIALTFSSPLATDVDFANAFVVTDELGAEIEGLTATLNDARTVGTLDLSTLELGEGVHTIKSVDNAIYNNSDIKASIKYTFDTVDFTAAVDPASIPQYIAGSNVNNKIAVALTAATTLTNDNIITAFDVTDSTGNYVNGLAAYLEADGKFITLDIQDMDLAPGKYVIKSNENLVDRRGRQLSTPVIVTFKVVTELSDATVVIEEDFENDYTVGENWLEGAGANLEVFAADGGKWEISGANGNAVNYMGVVDGTTLTDKNGASLGFDSNVLKVTSSADAMLKFWRRPVGGSIDTAAQDKMFIYEFDVWVDGNAGEYKFMGIDTSSNYGFQKLSGAGWPASSGRYWAPGRADEDSKWYVRNTPYLSTKTHARVIVDQTHAVDSMRTFLNGNVLKATYQALPQFENHGKVAYDFYGEHYIGNATWDYGPFEGIYTELKGKSANTTFYIDNLKVYLVNTIEFEEIDWGSNPSNEFNPDVGLTVKFSERIRANELKENLIVTDAAGNVISNAIKSVELSSDEKSAKVKFDFGKLEKFTEYNLSLNFMFESKDGAYIARDGIIDGGNVALANFTTGDKLEVTTDVASISGYDKGVDKTVTATLSSPLKADITDIAGLFEVKDEAGNVIPGLAATISDDRKVITLQLSGLQLGDGIHTISTKEGELVNDAGVAGSIYLTVHTVGFAGIGSPGEGGIANYIEGTDQNVTVTLTIPAVIADADVNQAFVVVDENETEIPGLIIEKSADGKTFKLNLKDLTLGIGKHTIKSTDVVKDSRGRKLGFTYSFTILPFYSEYMSTIEGYVPGTDAKAEIKLTYPLNASSVAGVDRAFTVKNKYGSNVAGLVVTVAEDNKTLYLDLAGLDIEGGEYAIASKPGAFVNNKGEVLADIAITLSTTTAVVEDSTADTGVGPNAGVESTSDFVSTVVLSENFDNEDYTRDVNWLSSSAFVPDNFTLEIVGDGDKFVDSNVSIVEDPVNPGNYVLKNVAGLRDATGNVIAGVSNYHKIKRNLDAGGTETIPVNDYSVVKLSTKVYIPAGGSAGIPTSDSGAVGNTKDYARIIALTNGGTTPLSHANLRKNSTGVAQYNSWINAYDSASGGSGSPTATLTNETWHTIELIFGNNPKASGTMFKSYEVWVDGKKITAVGGYYAADYTTIGGMMSMLASASGAAGATTVLYDDWQISLGNKLVTHINVPKEEVAEEQIVKLQLTNRLTDDAVAVIKDKGLVTLKDANGNDVKATIAFDNTGINTKVVITPEYGFKYQTDYKVEIASNYVDDKGIETKFYAEDGTLFNGFAYNFSTAKALGNVIDVDNGVLSYTAEFMADETTFNYTMNLKEPVGATEVIGAVATFSETNELLGIDYKVFNTGDTSKAFTVSSDLGTKYVRLFIWEKNADGTMGRLMQIPDEVTSR